MTGGGTLDADRGGGRADGQVTAAPGAVEGVASAARPRATGTPGSAGAVLLAYLGAQADRLAAEEERVRHDEPDAVHQVRVAARRLRSALQAYRPLLDRTRTDPLVDALRELGRRLAPARDGEVLRERIVAEIDQLDPALVLGPVRAQVERHFARIEAEARTAALAALDSDETAALHTALDDLLADPPLTKRAARPAAREMSRLVGAAAHRLERAVGRATDPALPAERRDAAVHAARKAGKRLRYATEVALPAVGKPAERLSKAMKGLQQALGEHQDPVVARPVLRELGAQAQQSGGNGFTFGLLYARAAARAERIEDELPALWASVWTRGTRRWLG